MHTVFEVFRRLCYRTIISLNKCIDHTNCIVTLSHARTNTTVLSVCFCNNRRFTPSTAILILGARFDVFSSTYFKFVAAESFTIGGGGDVTNLSPF